MRARRMEVEIGLDMEDPYQKRLERNNDDDDLEAEFMDGNRKDTVTCQIKLRKDIQGISWERFPISRETQRKIRLEQYQSYENMDYDDESVVECKTTETGHLYYDIRQFTKAVKPNISHFQLRNLVAATSKHDVYLLSSDMVMYWSAVTYTKSEVLDVSGHVAPTEEHPGSLMEGLTDTQITTLDVKDNLLVVGGFYGELICKSIDRPGISYCTYATNEENAMTNAVEIYKSSSGAAHFLASNNDCAVRDYDMEKFELSSKWNASWPVNHTSLSPDGRTLIVIGDNPAGVLVDFRSGLKLATMHGHFDDSFASAWHPSGLSFATGNQDKTCRIWDVRNLSKSVITLDARIGAVRTIRYSSDGKFMAFGESTDFVRVFDVGSEYTNEQEIDFFGKISGISFSPDTESLFIGVSDRGFGGLIEFGRHREYSYLNFA